MLVLVLVLVLMLVLFLVLVLVGGIEWWAAARLFLSYSIEFLDIFDVAFKECLGPMPRFQCFTQDGIKLAIFSR